jgi:hypothetical protein
MNSFDINPLVQLIQVDFPLKKDFTYLGHQSLHPSGTSWISNDYIMQQ